jgi:hypothetical protein
MKRGAGTPRPIGLAPETLRRSYVYWFCRLVGDPVCGSRRRLMSELLPRVVPVCRFTSRESTKPQYLVSRCGMQQGLDIDVTILKGAFFSRRGLAFPRVIG